MTAMIPTTIPRAALITGGAQRLGRVIALEMARNGFDIAIHCNTSIEAAEEARIEIEALGRRAIILRADLANESEVRPLIGAATDALGAIGVLVNNASTFERDEWFDASRDSWDAHMEPNLRAPLVLTQMFAHALPESAEGVIINMIDHPAFCLLHDLQGRPLGANADHGARTGAANSGERHRTRSGPAQSASIAGPVWCSISVCAARARHRPGGSGPRRNRDPEPAGDDRTDDRTGWRPTFAVVSRPECRTSRGMRTGKISIPLATAPILSRVDNATGNLISKARRTWLVMPQIGTDTAFAKAAIVGPR